jgi:putative spermidine/putrescine transport system permease protein
MRRRKSALRALLVGFSATVLAFLALPLIIVFPLSVSSASYLQFPPPGFSWRWFASYLSSPSWMAATALSLEIGSLTAVAAVLLGVPLAFFLTRAQAGALRTVIDRLAISPLIIPSIVTAIVVYSLFSPLQMIGSKAGLVLGHTVLALPFVVVIVAAALRTFDPTLEDAAMGLGASRLGAVLNVTLPQIRPSILSGAFFAFMASFDDLVISLYLSGTNMTLPRKTFENILFAIDPTIAAVSVLQILFVAGLGLLWVAATHGARALSLMPAISQLEDRHAR